MKNKKALIMLGMATLIVVSVLLFLYVRNNSNDRSNLDNLPGKVIGPNPQNIPENQLPICNFTGAGFVKQPCYSPPGSVYL